MKDLLDLNFSPINGTFISPSQELSEHSKQLLVIKDFGKKLEYYNENICSLAYGVYEGLHVFGQYGYFHGLGDFIFKKTNPNENPEFDTYLRLRQKEINRLKNLIEKQAGYSNKLKCFLEGKAGQMRLDVFELKIESNAYEKFIANGGGTVPDHLLSNNAEIDLRPSSPDERKAYNLYLYNYVHELIKEPQKFHWLVEMGYSGFLVSPALKAFKKQMQKAFNPTTALATEILKVEQKFYANSITNYIEHLYPYEIKNIGFWQIALFNAFLHGHEFDHSKKELSVNEMQVLIHVEQCLKYYKQLHKLTDVTSIPPKPIVETFSAEDNRRRFIAQFDHEFYVSGIPFFDLISIEPAFKGELLNQYLKAELKPCFTFYRAEFYSEKEYNNGLEEARRNVPESKSKGIVAASFYNDTPFELHRGKLSEDFNYMARKKTLPAKYYCPDIEKTDIVQAIRAISHEYDILKKSVFDASTDKYKEAELRANNMLTFSERLGSFAVLVLEYLKKDRGSLLFTVNAEKAKMEDFWNTLKSNFNNALSKSSKKQRISSKGTEIESPEFALFCSIVDESAMFKMLEESKESFCNRVKERFGIPANPKQARKPFNQNMDVKSNSIILKKVN